MDINWNIIKSIFLGLITAGGLGAVIWKLIQLAVDKAMQHRLDMLLEQEKESLDILRTLHQHCLDAANALPVLVGKSRNICRDIMKTRVFSRDFLTQLALSVNELESELYKYTLYMSKENYDKIHSYKTTLRKFLDIYTDADGNNPTPTFRKLDELQAQIELQRADALLALDAWIHSLEPFKRLDSEIRGKRHEES